jgi:magnesium transporter
VYSVSTTQTADETESMLDVHRISGFVLPRGLITVRLSPHFDIDAVSQRFDELGGQALDDGIEAIEGELFENNARSGLQRRTFRVREDLVELRRVVLPMREVVSAIQHRRLDAKTAPELDPLYSDLYDHVLRASEWTESLRDMVTTVFETNLSLQDARLKTVMKKLTGWAAIIAVPTAITGFYGQNVQYPGINTVGGFLTSTSIIVMLVIVLYWAFRRRDWL